jgi:hypothetical protein
MKFKTPMFGPEGEGNSGVGSGTGDVSGGDTGSVLYPNDPAPGSGGNSEVMGGNDTVAGGEGNDTIKGGAEWQEYVDDPAKTPEDNAAAKAEHDKGKPADDKPKADPLDTVPADGKYTLTLPDDLQVDEELLGALSPAMKEAGITGKQANTLAAAFAAQKKAEFENFGKMVTDWAKTAQADPEIGGANWDTSVSHAQKVINQFGSPALKDYLNQTGAGNHPEVIRLMAKVGAVISEDNPTATSQGKVARDTVATLYPDDQPKG